MELNSYNSSEVYTRQADEKLNYFCTNSRPEGLNNYMNIRLALQFIFMNN
jgi:hypothetical protein